MTSKDEKNLTQVIEKIATMDEPRRSVMRRVHDVVLAAAPRLKPRIWYGTPAYAASASTPALVTLRNDERLNLRDHRESRLQARRRRGRGDDAGAWYLESLDEETEKRIAEIVRSAVS